MSDAANRRTHHQIDRAYDLADRVVEGVGAILGVDVNRSDAAPAPSLSRVKTLPGTSRKALPVASSELKRALPALPPARAAFHIVEALDEDGLAIWIVTNGRESAECGSRAFADQVLAAILGKAKP